MSDDLDRLAALATFLRELAQALHVSGMPAHDLERHLNALGERLGVRVECFAVLTMLTLNITTDDGAQRVEMLRLRFYDYNMARLHRPNDKAGVAFVSNAIKRDHQAYLKNGGLGFLLGDGKLNYGREDILETYYNLHAWRGLYYAVDVQHIADPGYNRDRGPAWVGAVRTHIDF